MRQEEREVALRRNDTIDDEHCTCVEAATEAKSDRQADRQTAIGKCWLPSLVRYLHAATERERERPLRASEQVRERERGTTWSGYNSRVKLHRKQQVSKCETTTRTTTTTTHSVVKQSVK